MAAERRRSKSKKPAKKLNLFRANKSRVQREIGQAEREDRRPALRIAPARAIVVVIDDFDFGRKRVSVGTASAVFRVVSSSDDLAWTPAALPAGSMRSPALS